MANFPLKLSVLDQAVVPAGCTASDALNATIASAKMADALGFTRFWLGELHAMEGRASCAPEILIARVAAETHRLRVGSGAILLQHYSAFKVAEVFKTLHALYPNRIDLGVGRASGGESLSTYALRTQRSKLKQRDFFWERLKELDCFLGDTFPIGHPFKCLHVSPAMPGRPVMWILGTSSSSAAFAGSHGLYYAYGHFINPRGTSRAIERYRWMFKSNKLTDKPRAIVAVGILCGETEDETRDLYASFDLYRSRLTRRNYGPMPSVEQALSGIERKKLPSLVDLQERSHYLVGTCSQVAERLVEMAASLSLDEIMVTTMIHNVDARMRSFALLARALNLPRTASSQGE